jgi:hypothetical protein
MTTFTISSFSIVYFMMDSQSGETREEWSMLTVETEANRAKSTNEKGPSLVDSLSFVPFEEIFVLPWLL